MKFFPCIVLLLLAASSRAQPYYFRRYEVESGLSNNTVQCSLQDRDGFMWFGTKAGLNRFDGNHFKTLTIESTKPNSLSRDFITALAIDKNGTIWAGTERGLYKVDNRKERLVPVLDSLSYIGSFQVDTQNRLWFVENGNLCCYDPAIRHLKVFDRKNYLAATAVCQARDGVIWFVTWDGFLCRLDENADNCEKYNLFSHSPPPALKTSEKIICDQNGLLYIGTISQGVKRFDPVTKNYTDIITHHSDGSTVFVHDILQVGPQEFWFGTERGILTYNSGTGQFFNIWRRYLDPYSISDNAVYTICKDTEGGIWVGTYFGGVNYIANQYITFQKFFPDYSTTSIGGNAVREICQDGAGYLWIGTEDAGITRINSVTNEVKRFVPDGLPGSISHSNIHGLLVVKNELWIGTHFHGIDIMDLRTGRVKKHYKIGDRPGDLPSNFILTFLLTKNGGIYLGSTAGVVRYDARTDSFVPIAGIPSTTITSLIEDKKGIIWIGSMSDGLYLLDPAIDSVTHFINDTDEKIATASISSICQDSEDLIWVTTEGNGLWRMDQDARHFKRYTTADGLPSNTAFKILEDDTKTLWITTSRGLVSMKSKTGIMRIFTKSDGLLNDQFNYNSGFKDPSGKLYFGSTKGMIAFNPATRYQSHFTPPLFITGLQIDNEEVTIGQDDVLRQSVIFTNAITLSHRQSSFSIDFAALSYSSPQTLQYSYKMEGIDKEWNKLTANRRVYFTDLQPGRYTFRIRVSGPGFSGIHEKTLTIRIRPPLWATTWAYILYVLLSGAVIYYLFRSYHQMQQARKTKEIIDAKMEFFTNIAHEIKTPLTLIKGPVENLKEMVAEAPVIKEDVVTMERNTTRLINLVNQVLDFRHTEIKGFSLNFEPVDISTLLRDSYDTFEPLALKKKLRYELQLPDTNVITGADEEALYKILSNLFSNAVKYAATYVLVTLDTPARDADEVTIAFTNDGQPIPAAMKEKIFEPFFRLKEMTGQKGTGIGLTLARTLAELHGGRLYLRTDNELANTFVLTIPYRPDKT